MSDDTSSSKGDADSGSGTIKMSAAYLNGFATEKIGAFLSDLASNQAVQDIAEFGGGTATGAAGHYGKLLAGGGEFTEAKDLQVRVRDMCGSITQQINTLRDQMKKASADVITVKSVLTQADDENSVTASEMMQDLHDVLGGGGASSLGGGGTNSSASSQGTSSDTSSDTSSGKTSSGASSTGTDKSKGSA